MAFEKPTRPVERVFIHCSASDHPDHDSIEVMRRWHTDPKPQGRGWSDVGYHYFIRKTGRIEAGRSLERTPAAQRGHNTGTIAICLHGLEQAKFTGYQFHALSRICLQIHEAYDEQVTFHGHREVANKDCPVFDYRRVLGLSGDGVMSKPHDTTRQDAPPAPALHPVLRRTASGPAVVVLQELLNLRGASLLVDGIFGRATFDAVLAFQVEAGLVADGIVGPATWGALTRSSA
jgi:N-acetyl-anhydromuramyl-L-alanine amidase AmpD